MPVLSNYYVQIWNTYDNNNYAQKLDDRTEYSNLGGTMKFQRKSTFDIIYPWYPDYAFLMYKHGTYGNTRVSAPEFADSLYLEIKNIQENPEVIINFSFEVLVNNNVLIYGSKINLAGYKLYCTIFDITGKRMKEIRNLSNRQIVLNGFIPGIYILLINNGNENEVHKLVIAD